MKVYDVRAVPGDSAFLLVGDVTVLYDTGFAFTGYRVAEKVKTVLGERKLDYIFLTHSHYDHAAGSAYVKRVFPEAVVVAGEYAGKIFAKDSARAVMRELDRKFAAACGVGEYEDLFDELKADLPVCDGDTVAGFRVLNLPGHTKCSVGYWREQDGLLLSCESLGVYDGEGGVVPSYLVGYQLVMDSIARVEALGVRKMLLPHYGVIEGEELDLYLSAARQNAVETKDCILEILRTGTREDAIEWFKARYYRGHLHTVYPIDAMLLNTGITVDLLKREFLEH